MEPEFYNIQAKPLHKGQIVLIKDDEKLIKAEYQGLTKGVHWFYYDNAIYNRTEYARIEGN